MTPVRAQAAIVPAALGAVGWLNPQAPQQTKQDNKQARYDGTRTWGSHTVRFGVAVNQIDNLISADLFGLAPQIGSDTDAASVLFASSGPFAGGTGLSREYLRRGGLPLHWAPNSHKTPSPM